jgi:carotenoid cleavage dioxygenase-like enzyme
MAIDKKKIIDLGLAGYFEEMHIDLSTKKITTERDDEYRVEFPVVSDRLVGKDWEVTYAAMKENKEDKDNYLNSICKYNRKTKTADVRKFGISNSVSEPVLIETEKGDYLIVVVYNSEIDKSIVHLLDEKTLEDVYVA